MPTTSDATYPNHRADGYRKLEDANSLDLACEALIADPAKPYAHLFTDQEREAARARLAHHLAAIEQRNSARARRIAARRAELPGRVDELRHLAAQSQEPEEAIAVNTAILDQAPDDIVALNRLGRAYEATGRVKEARQTFRDVPDRDPSNAIASRRLRELQRAHG